MSIAIHNGQMIGSIADFMELVEQYIDKTAKKTAEEAGTEGLLRPQKAAAFLDMEYETFRKLKDRRENPCPYSGKGKGARYDRKDLLAWHKSLRY